MGAIIAGRGRLLDFDSSDPSAFGLSTDVEELSDMLVKVEDGALVGTGVVSFSVVDVKVIREEMSTVDIVEEGSWASEK